MRSRIAYGVALGMVGALAAGCASGGASSSSAGTESVTMAAGSGAVGPALVQWTGRFRPTEQQSGDVASRVRNQTTGSVVLTAPQLNETRAQISVTGPDLDPVRLPWAIAPGPCRGGTIPLLAVSQFPEITMNEGHGELDQVFSMQLPTSGSYHVNVYNGTTSDESGVMTCAELKLERRSK